MKNETKKPVFTVDIRNCYDEDDVAVAIAVAKFNNSLTRYNRDAILDMLADSAIDEVLDSLFEDNNAVYFDGEDFVMLDMTEYEIEDNQSLEITNTDVTIKTKKPNIFKRFWNWITRKK